MHIFIVVLLFGAINCKNDEAHDSKWNYDSMGPDFWPHKYQKCGGQKQSPINIEIDKVEYDNNLKPFKFINYERPIKWNVSHNGHTVIVNQVPTDVTFSISGSDFDTEYSLLQFHLHWGYNNYQGSEHYINSKKFPLEMHLVHKSKNNELTVLGFLFKVSDTNNIKYDGLLNLVDRARNKGNWQSSTFSLSSLLPDPANLTNYFRYIGSLTTPPCTEDIIWNVFETTINISPSQLAVFRKNQLRYNFREPQNVYDRSVYSSFPVSKNPLRKNKDKEQCILNHAARMNSQNFYIIIGIFYLFLI